jgi:glycosyltransferase involved in cell wall biosynthesis
MAGYYVPGVKGGGPIQSIKNLVDNLSDKVDFYIVAADRDLGDDKPYENLKVDEWVGVGNAKVFYTDISKLTWWKLKSIINSINYDVLYLNSFFSYKFSIMPIMLRKLKMISNRRIVLAPRGEFSPGALGLKSLKKSLYLKFSNLFGLYKDVVWHATTELEKNDIEKVFGENINIIVANNLTANYGNLKYDKRIRKKQGELKAVFISRINPKKNLKKAIEFLKNVKGKVEFNIYGPLENKKYWLECLESIKSLPSDIKVEYKGVVPHDKVIEIFKEHHIFLFPTLGENFGHVISEALIGGCPIIISDQTPWRELEKYNVGWDIKLTDEDGFIKALQYCVDLDNEEYKVMSRTAYEFGKKMHNNDLDIQKSIQLFG